MRPWQIAAPRWLLIAVISLLIFSLGVTAEYAREQRRDNDRLREESQARFQELYSADVRERLVVVEARTRQHSEEMAEFRGALKEFSRTVSDHGSAVRELAYQVRILSQRVAASNRGN